MKRKLSPKLVSSMLILLSAALLISVNVCAAGLSSRLHLRLDMTENQLYALSDETETLLDTLEQPIRIRVFSLKSDFLPLVAEVLEKYQRTAPEKVELEYIDPYTQPTLVDAYLQQGLTVELGSVLVEGTHYSRVLSLNDMFELDSSGKNIKSLKCEQQLTSAILYAAGNQSPHAVFLTGHNETESDGLQALLAQNNFTVSHTALSMEELPETADLVVIASPGSDYAPDEIEKLAGYLSAGGRVLAFVEPSSGELTNLGGFLEEWGIRLTNTLVAEKRQYTDSNPLSIVPIYTAHEINQYFSGNQLYSVLPACQALEAKFVSQNGISTSKLLYSTDSAYDARDPDGATGPFVLAMAAEKKLDSGKARMVVVGSKDIYASDLLRSESLGNAKLLSRMLRWCTEMETAVSIPAKELGEAPIFLTVGRLLVLAALLVVVLPVSVMAYGFLIHRKRRRS